MHQFRNNVLILQFADFHVSSTNTASIHTCTDTHTHSACLSSVGCVKNSPSTECSSPPRGTGEDGANQTWLSISEVQHAHLASAAVHSQGAHCQKPNTSSSVQTDTTAETFYTCMQLRPKTAETRLTSPHPLAVLLHYSFRIAK